MSIDKMIGDHTPWNTEAKFWSWVRGGIRRSLWMKHPVKITKKKGCRFKSPLGVNGKMLWATTCEMCNATVRESDSEVDHKNFVGSLSSTDHIQGFVERMSFISEEDLRILCKKCHGVVTYSQRYNVSLEEAKKRKEEIACKKKLKSLKKK